MDCTDKTTDRDGVVIGLTEAQQLPWRVGSQVGRTIYARKGSVDRLIGVMDTPELAALVVQHHNAALQETQ